ncbi:hypothetical protein HanIR_Chr04g0175881 [Helianthus annuus]|nr:hypothetical protein HanIR_Chr04g0175881 [Helianthus annuus]
MSDRSIGCYEPHTWASVWLHVVTMSFRRKDRKLMDLARYARNFKLRLNKEVMQGLEGVTSSWTGYISLSLVLFKVFC